MASKNDDGEVMSDSGASGSYIDEPERFDLLESCIVALRECDGPDEIDWLMQSLKNEARGLCYNARMQTLLQCVPQLEKSCSPFLDSDAVGAFKLLKRTVGCSHTHAKDKNDGVQRVSGTSTTVRMEGSRGTALVTLTTSAAEEDPCDGGIVEEWHLGQLVMEPEGAGAGGGDGSDSGDDAGEEYIDLATGRSQSVGPKGPPVFEGTAYSDALSTLRDEIDASVSLQGLVTFLLMATRCECRKCGATTMSVTDGFDDDADAEQLCKLVKSAIEPLELSTDAYVVRKGTVKGNKNASAASKRRKLRGR